MRCSRTFEPFWVARVTKPQYQLVLKEMQQLTTRLVEYGLADDINMAYAVKRPGRSMLVQSCEIDYASMLKDQTYQRLYEDQLAARAFIVRMLDGGLIQMTYDFRRGSLSRSRLAYLPSPELPDYENNAALYEEDSIYAHIVEHRRAVVPLRFDFDIRPGVPQNMSHPASHLTLGQSSSCRIAATGPVTPWFFLGFVLRSFYTRGLALFDPPPPTGLRLGATITGEERDHIHVGVPVSA